MGLGVGQLWVGDILWLNAPRSFSTRDVLDDKEVAMRAQTDGLLTLNSDQTFIGSGLSLSKEDLHGRSPKR